MHLETATGQCVCYVGKYGALHRIALQINAYYCILLHITSKPGGWEAFEEAGEKQAARIAEIVEDEGYSSEEVMEKVEKVHDKMKWTAFGKTKPRTKQAQARDNIDTTTDEDKAKLLMTKETGG